MGDVRTDPSAVLRHWRVEVNFEAWDEEDAARMVDRLKRPLNEELRLIFVSAPPVETFEFRGDTVTG